MDESIYKMDACRQRLTSSLLTRFVIESAKAAGVEINDVSIVTHPIQKDIFEASCFNLVRVLPADNQPRSQSVWRDTVLMPEDELRIETAKGVCLLSNLATQK